MNVQLLVLAWTRLYGLTLDCVVRCLVRMLASRDLYNMDVPAFAAFCAVVKEVPDCWLYVTSGLRWMMYYHTAIGPCSGSCSLHIRVSDLQCDVHGGEAWHEVEIFHVAFPRTTFVLKCNDENNM